MKERTKIKVGQYWGEVYGDEHVKITNVYPFSLTYFSTTSLTTTYMSTVDFRKGYMLIQDVEAPDPQNEFKVGDIICYKTTPTGLRYKIWHIDEQGTIYMHIWGRTDKQYTLQLYEQDRIVLVARERDCETALADDTVDDTITSEVNQMLLIYNNYINNL